MYEMMKYVGGRWEKLGMVSTLAEAQHCVQTLGLHDAPVEVLWNTYWPRAKILVPASLGASGWKDWCRQEQAAGRSLTSTMLRYVDNDAAGEVVFRNEYLGWARNRPERRPDVWAHSSTDSHMLANRMLLAEMNGLTFVWQTRRNNQKYPYGKKFKEFVPFCRTRRPLKKITSIDRIADAARLLSEVRSRPVVEFLCWDKYVFETPGAPLGSVYEMIRVRNELWSILGLEW